jgi:hypothetical protein
VPKKGHTRYSIEGKILTPLSDVDFAEGMKNGTFLKPSHAAYCVLLYYSAVRKTEGQRTLRDAFQVFRDKIVFDVGQRLKHSTKTPPIEIPLAAPYADLLKDQIEATLPGYRVFPFCAKTAYNVVRRAFKYPHLFRLSRITNFFVDGWTIAQIHSWTGLSVSALNYYIGLVDISKMAKSMVKKTEI